MARMWRLHDFVMGEDIPGEEVCLMVDGQLESMPKADALAMAQAAGLSLFAEWPVEPDADDVTCEIGLVALPLRWEEVLAHDDGIDETYWFTGSCGERDYLTGNSHTFIGRMSAWCPRNQVGYSVSANEITEMADATRHFIAGFLAGTQPGPPIDEDGATDEADLAAWWSATARFRRTGGWYGRWGTCSVCGAVLLPDTSADRCEIHERTTLEESDLADG